MFASGDQVGTYTIVRQIGAGGMGEVYEAIHRRLERRAAIKVLLPLYSTNQAVIDRFFNEAKAASVIRHPGIVQILDCDLHEATGRAYIVMELLSGESLGECLRRVGPLEAATAAAITGAIASALAAAHGKGITHRDLKPDNLFLSRDAERADGPTTLKVLDFGVAKLLAEGKGSVGATRPGALLGTPLYMAPEQCRSADRVDHRSDVYSLGCILFELLAGRTPFVGEGEGDVLVAHITQAPPDLRMLVPGVAPELAALVASMLAKEPSARPQSMSDVVRTIEEFLGLEAKRFSSAMEIVPAQARREATAVWPVQPAAPAATESASIVPPSRGAGVPRTRVLPSGKTTLSQATGEMTAQREAPAAAASSKRSLSGKYVALGAALGTVLIVAGVSTYGLLGRTSSKAAALPVETPAPAEPAPPVLPVVPLPPPKPANVVVTVSSTPAGAEVWIGEETTARGTTPFALSMPAGSPAPRVLLKSPSYAPKLVLIDGSHDNEITVALEKRKNEGKGHSNQRKLDDTSGYAPVGD